MNHNYPEGRKKRNAELIAKGGVNTYSGRLEVQPNEHNDCTVRAYAEAFGVSYQEAYAKLLVAGRKPGRGFRFALFMAEWHKEIPKHPRPKMTVGRFITYVAGTGNWIISIRGHVFAVKEGVIYDIVPEANINRHVRYAWRVK